MKNLIQDFEDKCEDESFSDWDLIETAKYYIAILQNKVVGLSKKKSIEEVE